MTETKQDAKHLARRDFPDNAFMPGALNNVNPRRVEAVFLNILLGKKPRENPATRVLKMTLDRTVDGDANARAAVETMLDEVWFQPNKSKGTELLITHVAMGNVFRPKSFYGVDKWCEAILASGRVFEDEAQRAQLRNVVAHAQKRPMNLVEDAICTALAKDKNVANANLDFAFRPMATPQVIETVSKLLKRLLAQADALLNDGEAERILLDMVALLRTAMYIQYIQTHLSAMRAVGSADRRGPHDDPPSPLYFGFETEAGEVNGRRFLRTRDELKTKLESGHYAVIALSLAHQLFDWQESRWFHQVPDERLNSKHRRALEQWHDAADSVFEDLEEVWQPPDLPETYPDAVWSIYAKIANNTRKLRTDQNNRPAYQKTFGILGSFALAEDGAIFKTLGTLGTHAMVDTAFILLIARVLATKTGHAPLTHIRYELESVGILLDQDSEEAMIYELERIGRLQRLSDSGESIYVRAD